MLPRIWRLNQDALTLVSIREIDQTLEWTEQEITPTLEPRASAVRLVYRLRSRAHNSVAFESVGAIGHAGVRALRMEFSRSDSDMLMLRFYRLNKEDAWVLAREALHDGTSQPNNGLQGTPGCP